MTDRLAAFRATVAVVRGEFNETDVLACVKESLADESGQCRSPYADDEREWFAYFTGFLSGMINGFVRYLMAAAARAFGPPDDHSREILLAIDWTRSLEQLLDRAETALGWPDLAGESPVPDVVVLSPPATVQP